MAIVFLFMSLPTLLTPSSQVSRFDAHYAILPQIDQTGPRSADPDRASAGQDADDLRPAVEGDAGAAAGSPDSFLFQFRS
ncbi:MAG TPA: hypothetical protein VN493_27665 [Thermoanaerobaculia bacterium]|nr:hypothetical protein [Thermoanaerobaculia bacterium]